MHDYIPQIQQMIAKKPQHYQRKIIINTNVAEFNVILAEREYAVYQVSK